MKPSFDKKWIAYAVAFLAVITFANFVPIPDCISLRRSIETYGVKSQIIYVAAATVAIGLFIPRTPLIFIAGIYFGAVTGTILNLIASLIAAVLCFYFGKSIKNERFDDWLRNQKWFSKIDQLAVEKSFFLTLAIRMSHVIHFGASSLALGLSPVRLKEFFLATLLGILPGTIALTYVGESIGCTALSGFNYLPHDIQIKLGLSFTLLTVVGILPLVLSAWMPTSQLKPQKKLHVQAHRGACAEVQENTLAAFERAIEIGADSIELDIHVTKDNQIVVYHDFVLGPEFCYLNEKKINKTIPIRNLTYQELQKYDCLVSRRLKGTNELSIEQRRIPLLKEVFDLFKNSENSNAKQMYIDIEIKSDPRNPKLSPTPKVFSKLLINQIKNEWDIKRTAVRSFDPRVTMTLRRKYKTLRVIQLTNGGYVDYAKVIRKIKPHAIAPSHKTIQKEHIEFIHRAGIEVMPWTANSPEDWKRLIEWGVDGITTDDPRALKDFLGSLTNKCD